MQASRGSQNNGTRTQIQTYIGAQHKLGFNDKTKHSALCHDGLLGQSSEEDNKGSGRTGNLEAVLLETKGRTYPETLKTAKKIET